MKSTRKLKPATEIMHLGEDRSKFAGAVVPPIFQNSLFVFESAEAIDQAFQNFDTSFIYTRGNNPTVKILEEKVAALEKAEACKFFASGMSAISAAILSTISAGDHIICVDSVYGPTSNFISRYLVPKFKVTVDYVKGEVLEDYIACTKPNTKLIYLESPSSGVYRIQDLKSIAEYASSRGIATIIDNTWATPIFQNPIALGIDLVVHSASKYLGGHSDVVAGCVVGSKARIKDIFEQEHQLLGGKIAPFEAWLILRGLRTLPIRMAQHQKTAAAVMAYLKTRPEVTKILYPAGNPIAEKQMTGFAGLFTIELNTDEQGVRRFLNTLELFSIGVSWGGYESLAYAPIISLSKELTPEKLAAAGIHPGLVRLFVGLEDAGDLILDLETALAAL